MGRKANRVPSRWDILMRDTYRSIQVQRNFTSLIDYLNIVFDYSSNGTLSRKKHTARQVTLFCEGLHEALFTKEHILMSYQRYRKSEHGFARIDLTEHEKVQFTEWAQEAIPDLIVMLTTIISEGYKISMTFDQNNDTWIVTITNNDKAALNKHTSMTSRHRTLEECALLALYKHIIVSNSGEWRSTSETDNWG